MFKILREWSIFTYETTSFEKKDLQPLLDGRV